METFGRSLLTLSRCVRDTAVEVDLNNKMVDYVQAMDRMLQYVSDA